MGAVSKLKLEPPLLSLLGFIISIAYIPGIVGAAIPTGWFVLIGLMPILICFYHKSINVYHIEVILFVTYCGISLVWTQNFNIGLFFFVQLVALGLTFYLGSTLTDLKPIFKGLAVGIGISGIVSILQKFYDWNFVFRNTGMNAGLFVNQDLFCEASVIVFISLIIFELWWWLPFTITGIVLVHSRAAILALIGCFGIWLWSKSKIAALVFGFILVCGSAFYLSRGIDDSIRQRLYLWESTVKGFTVLGNGIGSYQIAYPPFAVNVDTSIERPKFAHNDFLQFVFEVGIGTIFLILLAYDVLIIKRKERLILYAVGIISCFSFPFHIPVMAFIGCLVAGYITKFDGAV